MKSKAQSDYSAINLKQVCRECPVQDPIIIDSGKPKSEFKTQTEYLAISSTIICKKTPDKSAIKYESEFRKSALKSDSKFDQTKIQSKLDLKKQLKFNVKLTIWHYEHDWKQELNCAIKQAYKLISKFNSQI